jgi:hypothetical protein
MEELLDPDPYSESDPAVQVQPGFEKDHVSMLKNVLFDISNFSHEKNFYQLTV